MGARTVALRVLDEWDEERNIFIEKLAKKALADSSLSGRDRGLVFEICYGVVRQRASLREVAQHFSKHPLGRADRTVRQALAMVLYQSLYMQTPDHAVVDSTIEAYRDGYASRVGPEVLEKHIGFLNAMLRNACSTKTHLTGDDCHLDEANTIWGNGHWIRIEGLVLPSRAANLSQMLALKFSHPADVVRLWLERHDEAEVIQMMRYNNLTPNTYLVMRQQGERADHLKRLFKIQ